MIDGRHAPENTLSPEAELAAEFGASRITIREAVRILHTNNIVRIIRGRSTAVNPPESWTSLDAVMRMAVSGEESRPFVSESLFEVGAVQLAAERRGDDDLAVLERSIKEMADALERDDLEATVAADIRFHEQLMRASGNLFVPLLFESFVPLLVKIRRTSNRCARSRRPDDDADPGRAVDAVAARPCLGRGRGGDRRGRIRRFRASGRARVHPGAARVASRRRARAGPAGVPADHGAPPRGRRDAPLGEIVVVHAKGAVRDHSAWRGVGWANGGSAPATVTTPATLTAIPYALWANRGPSELRVWIPSE